MCYMALHCPVFLTQHILSSLSFTLSLPPPSCLLFSLSAPPPPPSPPSRSAWLARTCMSVDSVLCLLLWHAPTSLQCSPVCINWQRDSGYVVCRMGRVGKKGEGGGKRQCKDTIVTITNVQTGGQAVWQHPSGTDT